MKTTLLKFSIAMLAIVGIVSCGSEEPMSTQEAAMWIAAYTPERIDMDDTICIEATDSLFSRIDTNRSLDKVFQFTPSVKGKANYYDEGRYIEFVPNAGALKQGTQYNCRVSMSQLTGIDTLKDFSFDFFVERREVELADLHVSIDPNNLEQVIVRGNMIFSTVPGEEATEPSTLTCNHTGAKSSITTTANPYIHFFTISGVKCKNEDAAMKIEYTPQNYFSSASAEVVVPGLSEFRLLYMERVNAAEPYINLEFSAPISAEQELDGLIAIDNIEATRIERRGTNVKVYYPTNALTDVVVRISEDIRSNDGINLNGEIVQHFEQEVIPPAIEVPISGTILPDGNNLTFPFRAVNLVAVDVEVVKIYTNNVMTFLQDNEIEEKYGLRRVGRLIYKQTVRLDGDKSKNLHQWQNFSIDLKNLFKQEHGAIYNIRLSFRKAYSLYDKTEVGEFEMLSGVTKSDKQVWDEDSAYIYREAPDYDWMEYNWYENDDPTKDSYYMSSKSYAEYNLMASNIGLIVKRAEGDKIWCSVSNIMTAAPMSGVKVTAYNYQMREIGSAYTNDQGFADFNADGKPFVVTASNGISTTYLKLNGGHELSTSRFDVGGKSVARGVKGFVYGDRGVWRPGDNIYLTLIVEDKQRTLPKNHPVTMELYTPQEQLYDTQILTQGVDGIYLFTVATTEDVPTGRWDARFMVGGQTYHHAVRVETIKPNRLKIKVSSPAVLQSEEAAYVGIEAHWLTGPVAANLDAEVEMELYNNPHPFEQYKDYTFSNPLYSFSNASHTLYEGQLDSLGKAYGYFEVPTTQQAPGMLQANIIARVVEAGGDESLTSHSVRYSPYNSYVGIALGDKEFETDCDLRLPVIAVDPSGKSVDRELRYKIYKLDWSWWWEGSADELCRYVQSTTTEVVASGKVTTKNGKGEISFRIDYPSWGKYIVYVEDIEGGHATGGVVYIDWPDWRGHSGKSNPTASTMLSFSLDKQNYEVGEKATIYLPKSAGGRVLLSVENGSRVISRQWVNTSSDKETAYTLPVTADMTPNFYVHATLLQPHSQTINDSPIRMYGVEGAEVIDRKTILHPVIDAPVEILPQQEFTIKVHEADGKPMSYTLAIVDEGLLDITSYTTPQPWAAMNQREALGVKTWDMYSDVIGAYGGKFTSILSIGGDEALRRAAGKEKRFNPVVKFLGPFTLNSGTKSHKITLPMYVGSVRVMVVAAKNGAYGSADESIKVSSPLMLLATMPRQLACGDSVKLPINLFAMEEKVKEVKLTVETEGPVSIVGSSSKSVVFKQPSETLINFDLQCDETKSGQAKIIIKAIGGGQQATETIFIDVRNPLPDIIASESIVLAKGAKQNFDLSQYSSAELTIATMPTIDFSGVFSFVENYSHYCTEQLSARAMYMLYARKFLSAEDKARAEKILPTLLKSIESRQFSSGGFAYWPGDDCAHEWVTSMAGEVMVEARRQGFIVSNQTIERWKTYQNATARSYRHSTTNAADLVQAYRLYTLVLAGEQPTAAMNKLRESKSHSQQALLCLAAAYTLNGRTDVATKLIDKAETTPAINGTYEMFWSPLRDKALALESYLLAGDKSRAFELAREVVSQFSATACTTQEVAFVSSAMSRMSDVVGGASTTEVAVTRGNGDREIIRNLRGVKNLSLDSKGGSVVVENLGEEEICVALMMRRTPSANESIKPLSNGVDVSLRYTDLEGKSISIDRLNQGDEFLAHIDVKAMANDSRSMALTYAVPSGWEIWNERLYGGDFDSFALCTDIRDDRISWYFPIGSGESKSYTVKLRAAYAGAFVVPPTVCEDMYNTSCRAMTTNSKTIVE